MKIAIGGLCGALLFLAFGPAWAQPKGRFVPKDLGPPDEVGSDVKLVPTLRQFGAPVEPDQFTIDTNEVIGAYRESTDDKIRANLRSRLVVLLSRKFDSQHQRREKEINELKARLKQLTETHAKRTADRKGIIDRHADHLLREVDGLGWEFDEPAMVGDPDLSYRIN
ncbi:MAG: hypothetical protein HY290_21735 [Planctomycetia bacterium]|nr:hypothetical protein [Planctomycetia bacterium]